MEWPDAAHDAFSELPAAHRVVALYVLLVVGGIAVLMVLRKWLAGMPGGPSMPDIPGPPVNVQLIPFDQAVAAMRSELRAQINGSLVRIEEKLDALEVKVDERHAENQREFGLLHGRLGGREWDGRERRRP